MIDLKSSRKEVSKPIIIEIPPVFNLSPDFSIDLYGTADLGISPRPNIKKPLNEEYSKFGSIEIGSIADLGLSKAQNMDPGKKKAIYGESRSATESLEELEIYIDESFKDKIMVSSIFPSCIKVNNP